MVTIIHLTASTFHGGPERQMLGLAMALAPEVRSVFLSFAEGGRCRAFLEEARQQGFQSHELGNDTPHFRRACGELTELLRGHRCDVLLCHGYAEVERNPARRAALHLEWLKMRSFEHKALAMFDHVAAVSDQDAHLMRSWFHAQSVTTIPNGVNLEFYDNMTRSEQPDRIIYCSSLDSYVNQDAVQYLVKEVLPLVWEKRPGVQFMIVGSKPPPFITALASERVIVAGNVADVRPLLGQAAACVVPLRIGGGSRLKILEAFAAKLPVVSTSIGAEGLDVEAGKHLLIADGEVGLADAILRILEDHSLRQRLTSAGRALVQEVYDWKTIVPKVEEAWDLTLENYHRKREHTASSHKPTCPASGRSWRGVR